MKVIVEVNIKARDSMSINYSTVMNSFIFQFIHLNEIPSNVELSLLDLGVEVSIMGLTRGPLVVDGTAQEHSAAKEYPIQFSGKDDAITTSSLLGMKEIWLQALL